MHTIIKACDTNFIGISYVFLGLGFQWRWLNIASQLGQDM
jgi:hypothetical protein